MDSENLLWMQLRRMKWRRFVELSGLDGFNVCCDEPMGRFVLECKTREQVDQLLPAIDRLRALVWIVLGCAELAVYLGRKPVWRGATSTVDLSLISTVFEDSEDMTATTTLEHDRVGMMARQQIQEAITPAIDQVIDEFLESPDFKTLLIGRLQERLLRSPETNGNGKVETVEPPKAAAKAATKVAATPKKVTPKAATTTKAPAKLRLKSFVIASGYTLTLHNALKAWSKDATKQREMLENLKSNNEAGQQFINAVVDRYPSARREAARAGIMKPETLQKLEQRIK